MIHIGKLIEEEMLRQERTPAWLARKINCARPNVYYIFRQESINTDLLLRISQALKQPYYGQPYQGQQSQQPGSSSVSKPDTNLVWGILTTIMCCLPFGLVSIVYASKVDTLWFTGRYQEACNASSLAKKWALAAAITSIVVFALYVIIIMIAYGI